MKSIKYILCSTLVLGHLLPELPNLLHFIYPKLSTIEVQPFIGSTEKMLLLWYLKYLCVDITWILVMFVFAKVAYQYSFRVFRVATLYFFYHIFDFVMLVYNFRRSAWLYWAVLGAATIAAALILYPEKKHQARVLSIEN